MAGVAALAQSAGHRVTGSDGPLYPPMSDQLQRLGIEVEPQYRALVERPDLVVVGNVVSRGNPAVEWMLDEKLPYVSGPQWLREFVLQKCQTVVAVAGTHGKTTTASMVAWILDKASKSPGFLIGGIPVNFNVSARMADAQTFVVEADEYDTAFFDKRAKFIHYRPDVLILNNLEYDHADIYPDLAAIQRQVHHLVRTVPSRGVVIFPPDSEAIEQVLQLGCWSQTCTFGFTPGTDWQAKLDDGEVHIRFKGHAVGRLSLTLPGMHNVHNAMAAMAAAHACGVQPEEALDALRSFKGVTRRLQQVAHCHGMVLYDDFAHHPTEIAATISALRDGGWKRVLAMVELRSNSMRMGAHADHIASALAGADEALVMAGHVLWSVTDSLAGAAAVVKDADEAFQWAMSRLEPGDCLVLMSNGALAGLCERLARAIEQWAP